MRSITRRSRRARPIGRLLTALAASLVIAASGRAQTVVAIVLSGQVTDTAGVPIPLARLALSGVPGQINGDDSGHFAFAVPRAGHYTVHARRIGFRPDSLAVDVVAGQPGYVRVRLVPFAQELDTLAVVAPGQSALLERVGFYKRREHGGGYFMDRDQLEKRRPRDLTDALRNVPGLTIGTGMRRGVGGRHDGRGRPCAMRLVIDGMKVPLYGMSMDDLVRPEDILGLEVYLAKGEIPVEWDDTRSECGVVVVWTRDR